MLLSHLALLSVVCVGQVDRNWAGTSNYFLWAKEADDRRAHLDAMQTAGMKVVRVFITEIDANAKGGVNPKVEDLESQHVGVPYNDVILEKMDELLSDVENYGVKVTIAMHDRYSLGCWNVDGYQKKYGYPTANCAVNPSANNCTGFYTNPQTIKEFENRLSHILTHRHSKFNKTYAELDNVIFSFEPENEPQSYLSPLSTTWLCDRAAFIKSHLPPTSTILVTTGGFGPVVDPLFPTNAQCPHIDVMCVHDYYGGADLGSRLPPLINVAHQNKKRIIVQEFGAQGPNKPTLVDQYINATMSQSIPWMQWELDNPGGMNELEVWIHEPTWTDIMLPRGLQTAKQTSTQSWPEIWG